MIEKWPVLGTVIQSVTDDVKIFIQILKLLWGLLNQTGDLMIDVFKNPSKIIDSLIGKFDKFKNFFGFDDAEITLQKNISIGQNALALASASPIASQTSNSITNSLKTSNRNTSVQTGDIIVQTQATDPDGIAAGISGSLKEEMRTTVENFDDGIEI